MTTPVKTSVRICPGAVVCVESELKGEIVIGPRTVVHPRAKIIAEAGPIFIGEYNLIEEQAVIRNSVSKKKMSGGMMVEQPMVIGSHNVFEVGCNIESLKIGDHNVFESKCHVGRHTHVGNGCIVGAVCDLTTRETLPDNTVICGNDCVRRVQGDKPPPQVLQLDFLTKILPNYHHLKKSKTHSKQSSASSVSSAGSMTTP